MKPLLRLLPWCFVALFGAEILAVMSPKKDGEYHVRDFGRLPVLLNGRIQPFDSVARNSLLQIRSTGDLPLEIVPSWKFWHHPQKLKSTEWLLEVMTRSEISDTRTNFLIHHADLLGELKLQDKGINIEGLRYYTFNDLKPLIPEIDEQAQKAGQVKPEDQTTFQKQVLKLANALSLYRRLKVTLQPEGVDDFARELADFQKNIGPAQLAAQASESGKPFDKEALRRIAEPLQEFQLMARFDYPLIIPPLNPREARDHWQTMGASLIESGRTGDFAPAVLDFAAMAAAYRQHQPEAFNRAVAAYRQSLAPAFDRELRKGRAEFYFNNMKPFLHAMIIYLCAFVLAWGALLTFTLSPNLSESLRRSAFYLVILAGLVHTFGLVFRMALEGRPPVTNLYSSAIFIGWGTMLLGLALERIYRVGIGSVVASFAGFVTLMIAHNLALGGDTMEMLRAVLDTNFWLATHVVVVTLGYASTFAAGLLAILYIFLGLFTPLLSQTIGADGASGRARSPLRAASVESTAGADGVSGRARSPLRAASVESTAGADGVSGRARSPLRAASVESAAGAGGATGRARSPLRAASVESAAVVSLESLPRVSQRAGETGPSSPGASGAQSMSNGLSLPPQSKIANPKSQITLGQALSAMVYGIVCFATLFSFVGTVLGGIWADQSWGRFWGWDPKENGALLIVIWNAIILHARWGDLLRDRGIMNLAVFGNIVTSFSWFGVNMLGIGLHSYGFMDAAFKWLMIFIGSQVAIILLGLLPLNLWRSFRGGGQPPPAGLPATPGDNAPTPAPAGA